MPFLAPFEKLLIAKGEQRGIAKGIRDSLLRVLESRKLGELSKEHYRRIVDADVRHHHDGRAAVLF
ncbi:MAG: hypothetical protein ACP5I4_08005 [Oceanipulchritudo sp.]